MDPYTQPIFGWVSFFVKKKSRWFEFHAYWRNILNCKKKQFGKNMKYKGSITKDDRWFKLPDSFKNNVLVHVVKVHVWKEEDKYT